MYEYIKGELTSLTPAEAVIENGGIGYIFQISLNTYTSLQGQKECMLYIYQVIREDMHQFYGFYEKTEREIFLHLIAVSGIGPNTARMMLSSMNPDEIRNAVLTNDVNRIKSVKGIGLKTAQRIIIELKDKIGKTRPESSTMLFQEGESMAAIREESISALVMLGFAKAAVEKTVDSIIRESPKATLEEIIKAALKRL